MTAPARLPPAVAERPPPGVALAARALGRLLARRHDERASSPPAPAAGRLAALGTPDE
jgi:hypothetical protein